MNENGIARRRLIRSLALGAIALQTPATLAQTLVHTPAQTEGPFYPDPLPLDTDNDLLIVDGRRTAAMGQVTDFGGRVLDANGRPVRKALVEIWQVDNNGVYLHQGSHNHAKRDSNFQGFGRFVTGASGEYRFRTIKPVPYPGRTPHIHVAVKIKGHPIFTTQCYVKGESLNERDGLLNAIRDPRARASVIVPFAPIDGSPTGELRARFDIVLGFTPVA